MLQQVLTSHGGLCHPLLEDRLRRDGRAATPSHNHHNTKEVLRGDGELASAARASVSRPGDPATRRSTDERRYNRSIRNASYVSS